MLSRRNGFTLVEALVATGIAAVLAAVAYPSCADQVRTARRSDAIARLSELQLAQEQWRSNSRRYGSLAELRIAADSAAGLYRLSLSDVSASGYVAVAEAVGGQAADASCRFLRLAVNGAAVAHASGPDATTANAPAVNRRCWRQ